MIKRLDNSTLEIAKKIQSVFQASYKIEAELLKAINFPPLKRPLGEYIKSNTDFYGYSKNGELAGVIEIDCTDSCTHICSLVVDPRFFRIGVASALMEFTLNTFDSDLYVVETGLENDPACKLYKNFGFIEVQQWDTNHGIRKIKLEKRKN